LVVELKVTQRRGKSADDRHSAQSVRQPITACDLGFHLGQIHGLDVARQIQCDHTCLTAFQRLQPFEQLIQIAIHALLRLRPKAGGGSAINTAHCADNLLDALSLFCSEVIGLASTGKVMGSEVLCPAW
jgi:hypothetical protein